MGMYQLAYECYLSACQNFGMDSSMDMDQFVSKLTKEQLHEYLKHATN